jgi:hypothetical protein
MKCIGIDPGPHTGWVVADYDPTDGFRIIGTGVEPTYSGALHFVSSLIDPQEVFPDPGLLVVEDYIINPKVYGHSHQGDRGLTLRIIGALEYVALRNSIPIVLQMPTVKPAGYGFLGKKYERGKRDMHGFDALAHLVFYLVTKKGMKPLS